MPDELFLIAVLVLPFVGSCLAACFRRTPAMPRHGWPARRADRSGAGRGELSAHRQWRGDPIHGANGCRISASISAEDWTASPGCSPCWSPASAFWWCFTPATTCRPADPVPRFFSFLLAFMGAMLGIVLSGNLIQLVFFWELTSLFSFLLIGYWHQNAQARDGARMALIVTSAGGLCLLRRRAADRPHRRQLRSRPGAGVRRSDPLAPPLCSGPDPGAARRLHEERPVPVPFLAAARDGRPDAGLGLSAFRHHGEGRRLPAGAAVAGAGRNERMAVAGGHRPA